MQTQFNSLAKISRYHGPLLQSHGTADRLIPFEMGRQLFAAANEPKRFVAIPGGDHNDPQTDEYYAALFEFWAGFEQASSHKAGGKRQQGRWIFPLKTPPPRP